MSETEKIFQKRLIAYKLDISSILSLDSNFSRINLIATIVQKNESQNFASAIVDDGTGKILLRSFDNSRIFSKADIGDSVLIIGKVREFNNEKYVIPEIIKNLDNFGWMNVRKLELKNRVEENLGLHEDIYTLIRKFDLGEGADIDEVIKNSGNKDTETSINKLLENGNIFEIKPGRLKVLE